jgi:hypothetical protein
MSAIPELIAYIRAETQGGVAAEDLRIALMEAGWNERDIENSLHDVAAGLQSVTYGASIHEDLAQVRGMVAHLAGRMKTLEARLAGSGELPMPTTTLPSGTIGPERELPRGHSPSLLAKIASGIAAVMLLGFAGWYLAQRVAESNTAPTGLLWAGTAVGAVLLGAGYHFMRARKAWTADLAAASAVALWSILVWHAWQTYHILEYQTAIGLYVLLFVLLVVMGRWIDRLSR